MNFRITESVKSLFNFKKAPLLGRACLAVRQGVGVRLFIIFLLVFISCGKKEEVKLQTFSAEAFAFSLPEGWEVNATIRVKGFMQNKVKDTFIAKLEYSVDLVKPNGESIKALAKDIADEENTEEFSDLPIEVQINLDAKYLPGKYKLIFNIKDELSGQQIISEKELELIKQ
ncbi:MAG: hypothetical protein NTX22_16715 [Ignavibacteriales bacterium]|nr:hypothetical protein [Ignavibacteriales bacterium]